MRSTSLTIEIRRDKFVNEVRISVMKKTYIRVCMFIRAGGSRCNLLRRNSLRKNVKR